MSFFWSAVIALGNRLHEWAGVREKGQISDAEWREQFEAKCRRGANAQ